MAIMDEDYFFATWNNNITVNNSETLKYTLMMCIYEALQEEFEFKHLSGNLKNTIVLSEQPTVIGKMSDDSEIFGGSEFVINIVAMRYDINVYNKTGQILYSNVSNKTDKKQKIIERLKQGKTINDLDMEDFGGEKSHHNFLVGSYAKAVDESGGISGTHKNYAENCIRKGIEKWKKMFPDLDISSNL
jgi:hypothetical protein